MWKVIYLTGAPASGKSSTAQMLADRVSDLVIWEYGARLTEHVGARAVDVASQADVRARSASLVTPEDIAELDQALLSFVSLNRLTKNVLIDSHPVTKEQYGYRITPFSLQKIQALRPDEVWVLYTDAEETMQRIAGDSAGRPMVTAEEARMHTLLQASVAATYGISLGCPVYLFDSSIARDELVNVLMDRL